MSHYLDSPFLAAPMPGQTESQAVDHPVEQTTNGHVIVNGVPVPAEFDDTYQLAVIAALNKGMILWKEP